MNSRMPPRPRRSSSQLRTSLPVLPRGTELSSNLLRTPGHHHFLATNVHGVLLQRPRRRAGDNSPGQVVKAVVAGTPDLMNCFLILDGAVQVRTNPRERAPLGLGRAD